jgi:hypothetical protein
VNRIDPECFQRFDFAKRTCRPKFNDIRRAGSRQDDERGKQWPELTHHHADHDHAQKLVRVHALEQRNRLANDD